MARVKFIGDGDNDPPRVVMLGHIFPLGQFVTVDDPPVVAKLAGNRNFIVEGVAIVGGPPAPAVKRREPAPDFEAMTRPMIAEWCADHGRPLNPRMSKSDMIDAAAELAVEG